MYKEIDGKLHYWEIWYSKRKKENNINKNLKEPEMHYSEAFKRMKESGNKKIYETETITHFHFGKVGEQGTKLVILIFNSDTQLQFLFIYID